MKALVFPVFFVLGLLLSTPAAADSNAGDQAIHDLGAINGVALQCGYIDQVRRMKRAIIDNVPKTREKGRIFEEATNKGFLDFIDAKRPCPTEVTVESRVDEAVKVLEEAFRE
ncbi:MAG: hypothetical protein ACODAC_08170 [Pseudomonadota bacterium]